VQTNIFGKTSDVPEEFRVCDVARGTQAEVVFRNYDNDFVDTDPEPDIDAAFGGSFSPSSRLVTANSSWLSALVPRP
jgi:hypothetical protein